MVSVGRQRGSTAAAVAGGTGVAVVAAVAIIGVILLYRRWHLQPVTSSSCGRTLLRWHDTVLRWQSLSQVWHVRREPVIGFVSYCGTAANPVLLTQCLCTRSGCITATSTSAATTATSPTTTTVAITSSTTSVPRSSRLDSQLGTYCSSRSSRSSSRRRRRAIRGGSRWALGCYGQASRKTGVMHTSTVKRGSFQGSVVQSMW